MWSDTSVKAPLVFDSQNKHFLISLRQFKIYVADRKPQTIISFFPIYTKLYYRKRGLHDKLKHKLYKCGIIQVVTFLEKKSMITLANEAWQMEPNTYSLFHPTLLSCDHGLHFLKRDLLREHNPSLTALVLGMELFRKRINSFPNNKSFDWSKCKALADNKKKIDSNLNFVFRKR